MLEDHRHFLTGLPKLLIRQSRQVFAVNLHCPGCRTFKKIHTPNQCTLARTTHSDDSKYVPFLNIQINILQSVNRLSLALEGLIQMFNLNHWFQFYHPLLFFYN